MNENETLALDAPLLLTPAEDIAAALDSGAWVYLAGTDRTTKVESPLKLRLHNTGPLLKPWLLEVGYASTIMAAVGRTPREAYFGLMDRHQTPAMVGVPQPVRDAVYVALYHHTGLLLGEADSGTAEYGKAK